MINACIYRNKSNDICGFELNGHSDFSDEGSDIVCSAVSLLVINTVNSIEEFIGEDMNCEADEASGGFLKVSFPRIQEGGENPELNLILKVMEKGLADLEKEYGDFIKVVTKEVPIC